VRKGIPITSPQGVQVVSLVFAGVLALSAYFFVTTGWGTPFPGCWPGLSRPVALSVAVLEAMLAFGFVIAALQIPSTPRLKDSLLVTMVLALFASIAVGGGVYTLTTGIARFGRSGCLQVGAPGATASPPPRSSWALLHCSPLR
jgi:hypothetical protein